MTISIQARVANGAAYLDRKEPEWVDLIDWANFTIGNSHKCICGQIFGDYLSIPREIDTQSFGFMWTACQPDGKEGWLEEIKELDKAWKTLAQSRKREVVNG